jgi:hypothetical protein
MSNIGFAQKQNRNQQFSPEKVFQFLDRDKDQRLSKQEVSRAKRLKDNFTHLDTNKDGFLTLDELKGGQSSNKYTYLESDGIFMYYETEGEALYRKLLPEVFDMPERLLVYTFISDFYKMDGETEPYKETAIFLLGRYKGKDIWHCIYMPVTSEESMRMGIIRLGLPKTIGEIDFERSESTYSATLVDENDNSIVLSIDINNYNFNETQAEALKTLSLIPKMNLLRGEVIEMGKNGNGNQQRSIFDIAKAFPKRVTLKPGNGEIIFKQSPAQINNSVGSPLDFKPTKIIGTYYMHNTLPFKLRKKE